MTKQEALDALNKKYDYMHASYEVECMPYDEGYCDGLDVAIQIVEQINEI